MPREYKRRKSTVTTPEKLMVKKGPSGSRPRSEEKQNDTAKLNKEGSSKQGKKGITTRSSGNGNSKSKKAKLNTSGNLSEIEVVNTEEGIIMKVGAHEEDKLLGEQDELDSEIVTFKESSQVDP